jgi:hypothetical protein
LFKNRINPKQVKRKKEKGKSIEIWDVRFEKETGDRKQES